MPRRDTFVLKFFDKHKSQKYLYAVCKFCKKSLITNASRMQKHLALCKNAPAHVLNHYKSEKNWNDDTDNTSCSSTVGVAGKSTNSFSDKLEQSKMINGRMSSFIDKITEEEENHLHVLLCRAIYAMALLLQMVENKYFQDFIRAIRPSYIIPSRYKVPTTYLEKEYRLINSLMRNKIESAESLALLSDGWTDVNNISLINIIFKTPEPVFYRAIDSKTPSHTGQYVVEVLLQAINEVGYQKVNVVVTDNAANKKSAWKIIQNTYPHIVVYGCLAHCINLLIKDMFRIDLMKKYVEIVKRIIQFFKNKHMPQQVLKEIQLERNNKESALITTSETRWGSQINSFVSLIKNKEYLQAATLNRKVCLIIESDIRRALLDEDEFWPQVTKITNFLKPMADVITMLEGDFAQMSSVYPHIKNLEKLFENDLEFLDQNDKIAARNAFKKRKDFMFHPVQLSAYLLDPKAKEHTELNQEDTKLAIDFIVEFGVLRDYNTQNMLTELAEFKSKCDTFNSENIWKAAETSKPCTWWKGFYSSTELFKVAYKILSFPPTTGSAERNWKTFSLIKTKKRNKLAIERTTKLANIKFNLDLLKSSATLLKENDPDLCATNSKNKDSENDIIPDNFSANEESDDYEANDEFNYSDTASIASTSNNDEDYTMEETEDIEENNVQNEQTDESVEIMYVNIENKNE